MAKNNPKGKVNTSFKIKTRVANGDKRIAGILPNLSLVDGIHSKEVDRKSKYPSSLRSHLLFSIFSPKNNRAGAISNCVDLYLFALIQCRAAARWTSKPSTLNIGPLTFATSQHNFFIFYRHISPFYARPALGTRIQQSQVQCRLFSPQRYKMSCNAIYRKYGLSISRIA